MIKEVYKGHSIHIEQDPDVESPLGWGGPVKLVHWHRRGFMGTAGITSKAAVEDLQTAGAVLVPLYLYEHGWQTVSLKPFSCPWDSGQVGFLYVTREDGRAAFGRIWKDKARKSIESTAETLAQYLQGDVYYYSISGPLCDDALCGIWGLQAARDAAHEAIDEAIKREEENAKQCQLVLAL